MKKMVWALILVVVWSGAAWALPEGDLLAGVSPGADGKIDVLAVFPHEDDETIPGGGTLMKLKEDPRVRLHILCLTLGDMSDAKDWLHISSERLGEIRSQELRSAAEVLGADEVLQFDYHDQGLPEAIKGNLTAEIREVIESTGAEIVITYEPAGVTGHMDHVACSRAATDAFPGSSAQKLYYVTFPRHLYVMRMMPVFNAEDMPKAVFPDFKVDVRKYRKLKKLAMYEHASQKHFSLVGLTMGLAALPYEYFALAARN